MKIPLICDSYTNPTGEQILELWRDSKPTIISPPFLPYLLSKSVLEFSVPPVRTEQIEGKLLSTLKVSALWKYSFPSTKIISDINKSAPRGLLCENHTEFRERIIIDSKYEYFLQYPNTQSLRFFFFDLEWLTEEGMDKGAITSASYALTDRIIHTKTHQDTTKEKEIIRWLLDAFITHDPDIIVGYWVKEADLTKLIERCKIHGIDYTILARNKKIVSYWKNEKLIMKFGGRVIYDIFKSVDEDQTIYGLKNQKMKTVAEHFNIPVIWEETENTGKIPEEKLRIYNESDVRITMALFDVYFPNIYTLAEWFGCPLNMMIETNMTFMANIFLGAALHQRSIISDGTNRERHPEVFDRPKEKGDNNYQAAHVGIYQTGRFNKVIKVDFSGMYPALEQAINACPTTTKIIGYEEYQPRFSFQKIERYEKHPDNTKDFNILKKYTIFKIPDNQLNRTVVIEVDTTEDSFLRTELRKIRDLRNEVKKLKKTCSKEELPRIEARQYALKVIRLLASGASGASNMRWSDIAISIITVGLSRELISGLLEYLNNKYGRRVCDNPETCQQCVIEGCQDCPDLKPIAIELDTDGIYLSEDIDIEDTERFIKEYCIHTLGLDSPDDMVLEKEEFNEGYFFGMKNYILVEPDGELVIHGVSLKSNKLPNCFDKARDLLARSLLKGEGSIKDILNQVLNTETYTIKDFTMNMKMGHDSKDEYSKGSLQTQLINQYVNMGGTYRAGLSIDFVKAKDGYRLSKLIVDRSEIDMEYYRTLISRLINDMKLSAELGSRATEEASEWI